MRRSITGEEFDEVLRSYQSSAFRLEQQPVYQVDYEAGHVQAFLAGKPRSPEEMTGFRQWIARVSERTAAGAAMSRVRVHDVPLTDYQRWLRWTDSYNHAAGEIIHYLPRPAAVSAGIVPALGDWWLIDSSRLIVMDFDATGLLTESILTDDAAQIEQAIRWRTIAVSLVAKIIPQRHSDQ